MFSLLITRTTVEHFKVTVPALTISEALKQAVEQEDLVRSNSIASHDKSVVVKTERYYNLDKQNV